MAGLPPPAHYWKKHSAKYPFQITVPHFSRADPKPHIVQQTVNFHFLRVPFNGESHWGFLTSEDLERFKALYVNNGAS